MKRFNNILLGVLVIATIIMFLVRFTPLFDDFIHGDDRMVDQQIPDFSYPLYGGGEISKADLMGKVTVLAFWSPT